MYKIELPRVSPESVGIRSDRLLEMLRRLEKVEGTEMHGFMLARHGRIAAECWWTPYGPELVHINHSLGKSYVATAIGLACTEGLLTVDDRLVDLFHDEIAEMNIEVSNNLKQLRVKHVLSMTNGMSVHAQTGADVVKNYFSCDVDSVPGTVFKYNTAGSCILGAIVQKLTGMTVREYLTPKVFEVIGLEADKLGWLSFANGLNAAPGVSATTENNLRLGLLYLNGGSWNGKQIIAPEWIAQATNKQTDNDKSGESSIDGRSGYGYQLWMDRVPGIYRFDGGHGQICIMSPKDDMIIAIHQAGSMPGGTTGVMDILHEYFFTKPLADETLPEAPNDHAELSKWLTTRCLQKPESRPLPADYKAWNGIYHVTEGRFHINPELRPFDTINVYEDFYDREDVDVRSVSLRFRSKESLELVLDERCRLEVRMDGQIVPIRSSSAIPTYYMTYSAGAFEDDGCLNILTRYYQTCFKTWLKLRLTDNGLELDVRKNTLHDDHPWFDYHAKLTRVI